MDERSLGEREHPLQEGVDAPTAGRQPASADADHSSIVRLFVLQVVVWNVVLLAGSLGVFLIYFQHDWTTGGQLIAVAAVLVLYSAYRWPDRGTDG